MRYLIVLLLLSLTPVFAQGVSGKFVSEEGRVAVYVEETPEGLSASLTPGYNAFIPFDDLRLEGTELSGSLEDGVTLEGDIAGDELRLTLGEDEEQQVWVLTRQKADVPLAETTPLLSMLELVPDTATVRQGKPSVSFVDFRAGLEPNATAPETSPRTSADFAAMSPEARDALLEVLRRLRSGPSDLLMYFPILVEDMPKLLGFEWFDIDRALSYGTPPNVGTLLAAQVDPDTLAEKLARRDFERMTYQGTTLWQKGEEYAIDLMSREPGDPFVGPLGQSTRLAVLPDYLANTPTSLITRAVVDSYDDRYPSLADAEDYRTLAEALAAGEGTLVQAQFWNLFDVGLVPNDPYAMLEDLSGMFSNPSEASPENILSPYGLAVLADSQAGLEQVNTIALLYGDNETAQQAVAVLTARLEAARSAKYEAWGVRVDDGRVFESSTGLWAAVVSVRYPLPSAATDAQPDTAPGAVFSRWINEIYGREFDLLEVDSALTP